MRQNETNNGKRGGLLKGKPHYDKNGKPLGGIKAIVTDTNTPVELEGGEVIINKHASKKYWRELSKINQSAGNGVPIKNPNGGDDEDPEEYKDGGNVIQFNPNHTPSKIILNYAKKIKSEYPKVWDKGGNIFGNEAFNNLKRVSERGYWLDSEKWMYVKWRSYVARHKQDFRINGVVAMLKWVDKVDKGWSYMKRLIEAEIDKKYPKEDNKFEDGGNVFKGKKTNDKGSKGFMEWFNDWYEPINQDIHITFSLPNKIAPYKENNVIILDLFEKIKQDVDAKSYLKEIVSKADEYGVTIYLEPKPKYKYFLNNARKRKKISKEYLVKYFEIFGFESTPDNKFMKRLPKMAKGGGVGSIVEAKVKSYVSDDYYLDTAKRFLTKYQYDKWVEQGRSQEQINQSIESAKKEIKNVEEKTPYSIWYLELPKGKYAFKIGNSTYDIIKKTEKVSDYGWKSKNWEKPVYEVIKSNDVISPFDEYILYYLKNVEKKEDIANILNEYLKNTIQQDIDSKYLPESESKMAKGGNVVTYKNKFNKKYGFDENEGHSLEEISKIAKIKLSSLQDIYDKGIGAYKTNPESVRPNVKSKEQWAMARVYSAIMGGKASKVDANELSEGKMEHGGTFYTRKYKDGTIQKFSVEDYEKNVYPNLEKGGALYLAPNGNESNLTPEQYKLVRTPEFKAWFGDWENDPENASKVVDENGEPLVVYHGTREDFSVFYGGSYFTDDYMNAEGYASGEIVLEIFLNIKNPLTINAKGRKWDNLKSKYGSSTRDIVAQLDINKNDGVFFNNINDNWFDDEGEPQNVYYSINPNQIKLADGTNTSFDSNNPDIRFAKGGVAGDIYSIKNAEHFKQIMTIYNELTEKFGVNNYFLNQKDNSVVFLMPKTSNKFDTKKLQKYVNTLSGRGFDVFGDNRNIIIENDNSESGKSVYFKLKLSDIGQYAKGGLIAPNGNESNLTPEQYKLVRTPEFKAWFGDWENDPENASKVVDENGEPMVVYHGTGASFNTFKKTNFGKLGKGMYFTSFFNDAKKYANRYNGGVILEVFLNSKQLAIISNPFAKNELPDKYDGVWAFKGGEGGEEIVVFEPNQIKLADGTNTSFDENNPDIRYAKGGLIAPNGNESNLTPEQYKLVRTPEFKEWFGDWENDPENASKIVDNNGEPLVCYHGSNNEFNIFNDKSIGSSNDSGYYGKGFYFTFNTEERWMPLARSEAGYYGSIIKDFFIKSINPFDISELSEYKGVSINYMGIESFVFLYNLAEKFPKIADTIKVSKRKYNRLTQEYEFEKVSISVLPKLIEKYQKLLKTYKTKNNFGETVIGGYVKSEIVKYDYTANGGTKGSFESTDDLNGRWEIKIQEDGRQTPSDSEIEIGLIRDAIEKYDGIQCDYTPEGYMTRNHQITDIIKENYDSIIQGKSGDEIVVFEPNQIKLADGTNTKFDKNNPDIRFAKGGLISFKKNRVYVDNEDVGLFEYTIHNNVIEIDRLYLTQENQKSGYGRKIIAELFNKYPKTQKIIVYPLPSSEPFWLRFTENVRQDGYFEITKKSLEEGVKKYAKKLGIGGNLSSSYNFKSKVSSSRYAIPKVRGGWTKEKIIKYFKEWSSDTISTIKLQKYISEFDNWEQFKDHIYYHGSRSSIEKGLKPSITMSDRTIENIGGGGYGQKYFGISLTKRKRIAESFSGMSSGVNIYPVILKRDAKVIERTDLEDSAEIEDIIVELYEQGVDAVWIGGGEEELVIVNPKSILLYKNGSEYHRAYGGFKSVGLTDEKIKEIYDESLVLSEKYNQEYFSKTNKEDKDNYVRSLPSIQFEKGGNIDSDDFKNWFLDSKVVDKRGNPLVVYHGSPDLRGLKSDYIFKPRFDDNKSFFFTDNYKMAKSYADPKRAWDYQNAEEGVIGLYLSIQNPLIVDAENQIWRKFETEINGKKIVGTRDLIEYAKKDYDGVVVKNVRDYYQNNDKMSSGGTVFVVFEQTQIKIADGTNTTFDSSNPDIRYENGGSVDNVYKYSKDFNGIIIRTNEEQEYVGEMYSPFESKGSFKANIRKGDLENIAIESQDLKKFDFKWGKDNWLSIVKKLKSNGIYELELYTVGKIVKTFELKLINNNPDIKYENGGKVDEINEDNFHNATRGNFYSLSVKDAIEIMDKYKIWRRKKNKPEFIETEYLGKLKVKFESENKNAYFESRSLSYYFVGDGFVIRISDHWSESKYPKSKKLNCGNIGTCFWTNLHGESFSYLLPSQKYSSTLIGGMCYFSDFERIKYANIPTETGNFKAPNGNPTNLTNEQYKLVRTKAFKDWFGDWENDPKNASKVLDENGEPLVLYHGTRDKFNVFDIGKGGASNDVAKIGFWATPIYNFAYNFAENSWWGKGDVSVLSLFLNIKNPKIYENDDNIRYGDSYQIFKTDVYKIAGMTEYDANVGGLGMMLNNAKETIREFRESLNSQGFDGILIKKTRFDSKEAGGLNDQYVVFAPNQLKLADNTNTTFDSNNPDIRYAKGGEVINEIEYGDIFVIKNKLKSGAELLDAYLVVNNPNPFILEFKNRAIYCLKFSRNKDGKWHFYNVAVGFTKEEFNEIKNNSIKSTIENSSLLVGVEKKVVYELLKFQIDYLISKDYVLSPLFVDKYGVTYSVDKIDDDFYIVNESFVKRGKLVENNNPLNSYAIIGSDVFKGINSLYKRAKGENSFNDNNIKFEEGGIINLAPNGRKSNLTPDQYDLVRTPEFKAWFGDWEKLALRKLNDSGIDEITLNSISKNISKVVDENGEPLIVYHGTDNNFNVFDLSKIGEGSDAFGKGIYLTENKEVADFYANLISKKRYIKTYEEGMFGTKNPIYDSGADEKAQKHKNVYSFFVYANNLFDINRVEVDANLKNIFIKSISYIFGDESKKIINDRIEFANENNEKIRDYKGLLPYLIQQFPDSKEEVLNYIKGKYNCILFEPNYEFELNLSNYKNYVVFEPNQIKLADGRNTTFDSNSPDIRYENGGLIAPNGSESNLTPEQYKLVRTPEFKAWFGDWENDPENASKVLDENGEPLMVYHGTTHKFFEFTKERGNIENHFGLAYYFSSSKLDIEQNYLSVGADLTNRIERLTEQLESDSKTSRAKAEAKAIKLLKGKKEIILDCFLNFRNPINLTKNGTRYDALEIENEDGIYEENDDSLPMKLYESIRTVSYEYGGVDFQGIFNDIADSLGSDWDYTSAYDVDKAFRQSPNLFDVTDDLGNLASYEFIRRVYEEMGFDGIIMDANLEFGSKRKQGKSMIMDENTLHYMAFESNQIKLANGTNTTFDANNPDIRFEVGGALDTFASKYPKNKWVQLSKQTRDKFADNIANLIVNSYAKKGGSFEIKNADDVKKSDLDFFIAKDIDNDPEIDLTIIGKETDYGKKITIIAQDGSDSAKKTLIKDFERFLINDDFYCEVDVNMAKSMNVNIVNNEQRIREILNKKIFDFDSKDGSYKREITGLGVKTKMLVGFPMEKSKLNQFEQGGELKKGIEAEREHLETAKKLYENKITPEESAVEIAKDHLKENKHYYTELAKLESRFENGGNIKFSKKTYIYPSELKPIFWQMTMKQFCDYAKANNLDTKIDGINARLQYKDIYKYKIVKPLLDLSAERNVYLLAIESNRMPYELVKEIIESVDCWDDDYPFVEEIKGYETSLLGIEILKTPKELYLNKEVLKNNFTQEDVNEWYKHKIYQLIYANEYYSLNDLTKKGLVKYSDIIDRIKESLGMENLSNSDKMELNKMN